MDGKLSIQQKRIVLCACLVSFVAMDSSLTNTIFSYIVDSYPGVPQSELQMFLRIGPIVGTAAALLIGPVSERVSQKAMIVFALSAMASIAVIYIWMGGSCPYRVLILCSGMDGLETSILSSIPSALVTVHIPNRGKKNRYNGYIQASKFAGALLFSTMGGLIAVHRWQYAYGLYLIALPIMLVILRILPSSGVPKPHRERTERTEAQEPERYSPRFAPYRMVVLIYLQYIWFFICTFTLKANLSIYVIAEYRLGTSVQAGMVNSVNTLAGIAAGVVFGILARKARGWTGPMLALLLAAGFLIMTYRTSDLYGCIVGTFLIGFAKGAMTPFAIYKLSTKVPKWHVTTAISLLIALMNFGQAMSSPVVRGICRLLGDYSVHNQLLGTTILALGLTVFSWIVYVVLDGRESDFRQTRHRY